jgi:hypothetical protein
MNRLLGLLVVSGSMVFTSALAVCAQEKADGGQSKKPTKLTDEQKAATTAEAADTGPKSFSIPRPPVALEGNDSVAFWASGEVVPGEDRFVSVFDGQIYRFIQRLRGCRSLNARLFACCPGRSGSSSTRQRFGRIAFRRPPHAIHQCRRKEQVPRESRKVLSDFGRA